MGFQIWCLYTEKKQLCFLQSQGENRYLLVFILALCDMKTSRQRGEKDREQPMLSNCSEMSLEHGNWQLIWRRKKKQPTKPQIYF